MAQLVMYRPIGANPLPEESAVPVRAATRADGPQMAAVLGAAFPEMKWDEARVHADLTDATDVPVTFVVEERGKIVATASVRYNPKFPDSGYVHWVGVDPAHRGKQLGTVVMAKVMRRFLADGYKTVILETDDFRLPAIASYLGQGFIPHYTETDHEERWSKVFEQLAQSRRTTKGK